MIDVFDGTLGVKFKKEDIVKALTKYLIMSDEDLSYGIVNNHTKVMFITGLNEEENKIPTFYHPVIFEYRQDKYIAMDMRLFVTKPKTNNIDIFSIIKDTNNGKLAVYRTILTKLFLDNELRFLLAIDKSVYDMFNSLMTILYRNLTMDGSLMPYVMVTTNYYYNMLERIEPLPCSNVQNIIYQNVRSMIKISNPTLINDLEEGCKNKSIPNPPSLIGDYVDVMSFLAAGTKAEKVTSNLLMTALGRTFFALNGSELGIAFFESKANMIAIIYNVLTNSLQKKSILYKSIDATKRFTKPQEFVNILTNVLNENIVRG